MKPEWEEEHRQDFWKQWDKFQKSGAPLQESLGYRQTNFNHGNECSECNNAILLGRNDHFDEGKSEGK